MASAFGQAWSLLKSGVIRPIGTVGNRKVVMVGGVPYYQSTGTSHTPGLGKKEAGAWFPFAGIETQPNVWRSPTFSNPENWWMKGKIFNTNPYNSDEHVMDWKTQTPTLAAQRIARVQDRINPPPMSHQELNDALIDAGWTIPTPSTL